MFTIEAKTFAGTFVPVLGALLVGDKKHHGVEWDNAEQAARAAVIANPDVAHGDLRVVNGDTGEAFSVADILDTAAPAESTKCAERLQIVDVKEICITGRPFYARAYIAWLLEERAWHLAQGNRVDLLLWPRDGRQFIRLIAFAPN
ncbi:hypothetical protein SAMN05216577_12811 [Pseudomonas citronellolis]|uniref:Uncharacterized protein n=1 Tax=Pseudomonas citronellolis TaxID=53408 RepID=A0AAQ1KIZ4_9PSED|nr:hypothetical protein [Pseudomonas citronellolis]TGC32405.1 hypothetical protein CW310_01920 [Pseudomonas citronellolis]SFD51794.1 hypothetical protein SAMN05216577_12811 [Pseudomonas citronellolis]